MISKEQLEMLKRFEHLFAYGANKIRYRATSLEIEEKDWPTFWDYNDKEAKETLDWLYEKLQVHLYLWKSLGVTILSNSDTTSNFYCIAKICKETNGQVVDM